MLSRTLLIAAITLLIANVVFRLRFRELGRRLDRAVSLILVLIVVTYGAYVAGRIFQR